MVSAPKNYSSSTFFSAFSRPTGRAVWNVEERVVRALPVQGKSANRVAGVYGGVHKRACVGSGDENGMAILGGGFGNREMGFSAVMTICAYHGRRSYRFIEIGWLLHSEWVFFITSIEIRFFRLMPHPSCGLRKARENGTSVRRSASYRRPACSGS